jgi:hypothetical protein
MNFVAPWGMFEETWKHSIIPKAIPDVQFKLPLVTESLNVSKNNNSDSFVSFIIPSFDIQIPSVLLTSSSSSESSILSIFTPFRLLVQVPNNFPSQITSLDLIIRSVFGF